MPNISAQNYRLLCYVVPNPSTNILTPETEHALHITLQLVTIWSLYLCLQSECEGRQEDKSVMHISSVARALLIRSHLSLSL